MIYIDGVPTTEYNKLYEEYNKNLRKKALESEYNGTALVRLDISVSNGAVTGCVWTSSFEEGLKKKYLNITHRDSIPIFLKDNHIEVFDYSEISGIIKTKDVVLYIKKDMGSTNHLFRMIGYFLGDPGLYQRIPMIEYNHIQIYRACINAGNIDECRLEHKIKQYEDECDFQLVYNERNWYSDFCFIDRKNENILEFNSIDEIRKSLKSISPDSVFLFDDYAGICGTFSEVKQMTDLMMKNGANEEEFGYDNAGRVFKEIIDIVSKK